MSSTSNTKTEIKTTKPNAGVGIGWKSKFAETSTPTLHSFLHKHPLSALTIHLPTSTPALQAPYIPFIFDAPSPTDPDGTLGTLRGHMALVNPHAVALINSCAPAEAFDEHGKATLKKPGMIEEEVMVLFTSPTESYVTPSFYTETKPMDGKVVPTWFSSAVQVYGKLTLHPPSSNSTSFLQQQFTDLTRHCESNLTLLPTPASKTWHLTDSPPSYISLRSRAIIGLEIRVTRLEGKKKFGQEVKAGNQMGCIRGFGAAGNMEMVRGIEKCMLENTDVKKKRGEVLEREKGLVLEKKVKGRFGWYYEAVKPDDGEKVGDGKGIWW